MGFAIPKNEKGILLYIWQILDTPQINEDFLYSMMAFKLQLGSPEKCKNFVETAIEKGLLIEHSEKEEVELSSELQQEIVFWQAEGENKATKMRAILNQPWRESFVANDEMLYNTFERDLIDPTVRENSIKILGSRVQIETLDFNSEISGVIIEGEEDSASNVAFSIDIVRKVISHSCSEYDQYEKVKNDFAFIWHG